MCRVNLYTGDERDPTRHHRSPPWPPHMWPDLPVELPEQTSVVPTTALIPCPPPALWIRPLSRQAAPEGSSSQREVTEVRRRRPLSLLCVGFADVQCRRSEMARSISRLWRTCHFNHV
ncbi:hypothetical protein NDU88_001348 [Pleurodeles waltl]|uniref:Uncharacterized protein n=1 Tax=Pleurodeles waltl TaxID=8319 RepID=A0AAV7MKR2_PLEWA|nr:hypothetical protein NDU88_001348 [Pleurodeles waltl]